MYSFLQWIIHIDELLWVFWPASGKNKPKATHISDVKHDFSVLIVSLFNLVIFYLMYVNLHEGVKGASEPDESWGHSYLLREVSPELPGENLHGAREQSNVTRICK